MILVIGATGRVGSEVARQLLLAGEHPRAFVRDAAKARAMFADSVELATGNLGDPDTLLAAMAGVDRVFLATTQDACQPVWEQGAVNAAVAAGVHHVVKLSVFRAAADSPLQIARQHHAVEGALARSGLETTVLRPVFFMQNLLAMVRDGILATAAEDGRVAMIDSSDVAAVATAALLHDGHGGRTYTLTGPEALTFDEVAATLAKQTETDIRHVRVEPGQVRSRLEANGIASWFARDMATLHAMLADGYEDEVTDDVERVTGVAARSLAGFAADYSPSR